MRPAYSDPELLQWTLELAKEFNLKTFFETGAFHGLSSKIVSEHFEKVITVESDDKFHQEASSNLKDISNCTLFHNNSPEVMERELKKEDNSIFFFLDAHWNEYWPLLDELKIIKEKNIKPVIAIHDFFIPDENGRAKFGFDSYGSQILNFDYIKASVEEIYGNNYEIKYSTTSTNDSGVIFIYPKK